MAHATQSTPHTFSRRELLTRGQLLDDGGDVARVDAGQATRPRERGEAVLVGRLAPVGERAVPVGLVHVAQAGGARGVHRGGVPPRVRADGQNGRLVRLVDGAPEIDCILRRATMRGRGDVSQGNKKWARRFRATPWGPPGRLIYALRTLVRVRRPRIKATYNGEQPAGIIHDEAEPRRVGNCKKKKKKKKTHDVNTQCKGEK